MDLKKLIADLEEKNPAQPCVHSSCERGVRNYRCLLTRIQNMTNISIVERLLEPERIRIIQFKVTWVDDAGKVQVNRGYPRTT